MARFLEQKCDPQHARARRRQLWKQPIKNIGEQIIERAVGQLRLGLCRARHKHAETRGAGPLKRSLPHRGFPNTSLAADHDQTGAAGPEPLTDRGQLRLASDDPAAAIHASILPPAPGLSRIADHRDRSERTRPPVVARDKAAVSLPMSAAWIWRFGRGGA